MVGLRAGGQVHARSNHCSPTVPPTYIQIWKTSGFKTEQKVQMVAPLSVESDLQDSPWRRSCQSEFLGYCLRPWIDNVNWSAAAIYIFADSLHFCLWQRPLLLALTGSWSDPRTGLINRDSKIFCWLYCELGLCAPATHLRLAGEMFQDVPVSIHKRKYSISSACCVCPWHRVSVHRCLSVWVSVRVQLGPDEEEEGGGGEGAASGCS